MPRRILGGGRNPIRTVLEARPKVAEIDAALRAIEVELADPALAGSLSRMQRIVRRQEGLLDRWVRSGGPAWGRDPVPAARPR